jgi:hypothetical protein
MAIIGTQDSWTSECGAVADTLVMMRPPRRLDLLQMLRRNAVGRPSDFRF